MTAERSSQGNSSNHSTQVSRDVAGAAPPIDLETRRDSALKTHHQEVMLLVNGDEIFPAMLQGIRSAKHSICFETYIYWSGQIADTFAQALIERARDGVAVHVILDWYGSLSMSPKLIAQMLEAGVEVVHYRPLKFFKLLRTNYRTHRKLLVIDGTVGFTGGVGIADEWTGNGQDARHWRDNHYRFTGHVVREMQAIFFENWRRCGQELPELHDERYYCSEHHAPCADAKVHRSSPFYGDETTSHLFKEMLDRSTQRLWMGTAYFVPDRSLVDRLIAASRRGVSVKVLTSGQHIDREVVRHASRAGWGPLLRAGLEIYEYEPTLYHAKMLLVDDAEVLIGSANFDSRSCRLNDEVNVTLENPTVVRQHQDLFLRDLKNARQITLEEWKHRSLWQRLKDRTALLFRKQL